MDSINVLLPITKQMIGEKELDAVDAKYLHSFLESKQHFTDWIKQKIKKNNFILNKDFTNHKVMIGKHWVNVYTITIRMAKHLCMLENNAKGEQARDYFIKCEQKLTTAQNIILEFASDPIISLRLKQLQIEKEVQENKEEIALNKDEIHLIKDELRQVGAKVTTIDDDYYTIAGYGRLIGLSIPVTTARKLGKEATKLSKDRTIPTGLAKSDNYGTVNTYHTHILQIVFTNYKNK